MTSNEVIANVNIIAEKILGLMKITNKSQMLESIAQIDNELYLLKDIPDLEKFVVDVKDLLSAFENNPFDNETKNKSILRILSIVSSERSRIIDKYELCGEPE